MVIESKNGVQLESTKRIIYAFANVIGITPGGNVYSGYDDVVWAAGNRPPDTGSGCDPPFTRAERTELADYVIGLWTAYKEQAAGD